MSENTIKKAQDNNDLIKCPKCKDPNCLYHEADNMHHDAFPKKLSIWFECMKCKFTFEVQWSFKKIKLDRNCENCMMVRNCDDANGRKVDPACHEFEWEKK